MPFPTPEILSGQNAHVGHNRKMQTPPVDSFAQLSRSLLVEGMTEEQIKVLASCGKYLMYEEGEALVTREDTVFDLLLIVDGKCEIRTDMNDLLYRLGPDSLIGEVSFLDHKVRSAKAVASGQCQAICFPASLLNDLEADRPDIVAKLLKNLGIVLCQKLRSTTRFAEASFV